jgi:hypothetical protein
MGEQSDFECGQMVKAKKTGWKLLEAYSTLRSNAGRFGSLVSSQPGNGLFVRENRNEILTGYFDCLFFCLVVRPDRFV